MNLLKFFAGFNLRDEIFQETRDASLFASIYSSYISKELSHVNSIPYTDIGALIIEPGKILLWLHFCLY